MIKIEQYKKVSSYRRITTFNYDNKEQEYDWKNNFDS